MTANKTFAILIATKNRVDDLAITLNAIRPLLDRQDVRCLVCDDGSDDGTSKFVKSNFPTIELFRHEKSKGYLHSRNKMLNRANAEYAISLDDDAHFLSQNPLETIRNVFSVHQNCGAIAFRILWNKSVPGNISSDEKQQQVKGFVGCGHAWRMDSWKQIPDYPEWFQFYGEEDYASLELFKNKMAVFYAPEILVQHRVDLKARRSNSDYAKRLRRSLASGWYLYFLFYPKRYLPRKMAASLASQFRTKIFKGNFHVLKAVLLALADLILAIPKIVANRNPLSVAEYSEYQELPDTKIFWTPK